MGQNGARVLIFSISLVCLSSAIQRGWTGDR